MRSLLGRALRRLGSAPASSSPGGAPPTPPSPSAAPRTGAAGAVAGTVLPVGALSLPERPPGLEEGLEVEVPVPGSLLLDVREPGEYASGVAEGALLIPMDLVPHQLAALPKDRPITVYCAAGARSAGVAHWLREQGFAGAVSLAGGIGAVRFGGGRVVSPPGLRPGTKLRGTPTSVPGLGDVGPQDVEVIEQVGEVLRVRFWDAQGVQVEGTARAP